eukprot:Sspe_Gene.2986::Locus_995_Transcript_1_1_Confidence_1.000_Length_2952::g.2986::m.2986
MASGERESWEGDDETMKAFLASVEELTEKCNEALRICEEVTGGEEEVEVFEREASADDSEYWGRLYHAMSDDFELPPEETADPPPDEDDLQIHEIVARREHQKMVYYQVRWKEHNQLTWERADDIAAAKNLLTAFDESMRKNAAKKSGRRRRDKEPRASKGRSTAAPRASAASSSSSSLASPPPPCRGSGKAQASSSRATGAVASTEQLHKIINRLDAEAEAIEKKCASNAPAKEWPKEEIDQLVKVYDEIMQAFADQEYKSKYHACGDDYITSLPAGEPVPSYFANTGGESIWLRKALSIAGLRNLVLFGRQVYSEMKAKLFVGNPASYGPNEGPNRMKTVTGNVVDLDTTVLRCSDRTTLAAINQWNKHHGQPTFSSTQEFGSSQQARDIAVTAATTLLAKFNSDFKLSKKQMKDRHVDPQDIPATIPVATHNTDRGRWPVWHYTNCGVDSYHANVPSMDDVHGALLRAPLHCARAWIECRDDPEDRRAFFEDCIVDSCFNMKWKAIEEFNRARAERGSIAKVLEQLQADHQSEFLKVFEEDDEEKEVMLMLKLLPKGAMGKCSDGSFRPITEKDVRAWVADPACKF